MKNAHLAESMSGSMIAQYLPLVDISGNVMVMSEGGATFLTAGISCRAGITGTMADAQRHGLYEGFRALLRTLPEGASIQFHYGQESRAADVKPLLGAGIAEGELVREALEQYSDLIVGGVERGAIRATTLDIYVSIPCVATDSEMQRRVREIEDDMIKNAPARLPGFLDRIDRLAIRPIESLMNGLLSPMKGTVILALHEYKKTREQLLQAVDNVFTAVGQLGMDPELLNADGLLGRYYRKWNPSKYEHGLSHRPYSEDTAIPISEHFLNSPFDWDPTGERVKKGYFFLDGYYHKILTLIMPPDPISFPHMEPIALRGGIQRAELIVNLTESSVQDRIKALIEEEKAIRNNADDGTKGAKLRQLVLEKDELGAGEERIWKAQHIAIVRGKTYEECEALAQAWLRMSKQEQQADFSEEVHAVWQYWLASQPGWCKSQDENRHNIYNTRQVTSMLPVFGNPGLRKGSLIGAVYPTTDGGLHNIFLHDQTELPNPNGFVFGGPGRGKSVLVCTLETQLARHNPRLVIVDIGASYRRLCLSMGGRFLEYDIRSTECRINIFDIFKGRVADQAEIQAVILILEKMVVNKPGEQLDRDARSLLQQCLMTAVEKYAMKEFFLRNLREIMQGMSDPLSQNMALRLSDYVLDGTYANLFDGSTNIPRGKRDRITVFELGKVRETAPDILPLVFQSVTQYVMSLAANYPDDLKILAMDEAHVLLKDPVLREFVEYCYRTFRKRGVGVLGISQNLGEWFCPGEERLSILNCGSVLFICQISEAAIQEFASTYNLTAPEVQMIRDIQVKPGYFSEFVVLKFTTNGRRMALCRNRITPLQYAMYTTAPADVAVLSRWESRGMPLPTVIREFARKYPNGVQARGLLDEDRVPQAA